MGCRRFYSCRLEVGESLQRNPQRLRPLPLLQRTIPLHTLLMGPAYPPMHRGR